MQHATLLALLTKAEAARDARRQRGFRVAWSWYDGSDLKYDFSPEKDEDALSTEADAWALASRIAAVADQADDKTDRRIVDIYVIDADGTPVAGAERRMLRPWLGRVEQGRLEQGRLEQGRESIAATR